MYQELLKEWIKTIPSKENRKYLKEKQELKVFAEWLDERAAQQSVQRIGDNVCPLCGLPCGNDPVHPNCDATRR